MTDPRPISFAKMQGTGNDFLVLDNRTYQFAAEELSAFAAEWCPRRYGIGADGLLALDYPESGEADYRMQYVNADGSRATMCGNGARCLYRFARGTGFDDEELVFESDAGLYRATVPVDHPGQVRLFVPDVTAFRGDVTLDQEVSEALGSLYYVHTGTEHLVAMVDHVEDVPVQEWGRRLRSDPALEPAGANVNFLEIVEKGRVRLRTYEKGVEAETLSCGTGVVAAAVVAERTGWGPWDSPVEVITRGGRLRVGTAPSSDRYLEGPAVEVFRGRVSWSPSPASGES